MMNINKSVEYVAAHRSETIKLLLDFMETDTILFWSDVKELCLRQQQQWQPVLDLLQQNFGLDFNTTVGLYPADNTECRRKFSDILQKMSDNELTACFLTSSESKSVLLGMLMSKRQITAQEVFFKAFLEELYQNEFWGTDEAVANKHKQILSSLCQIEDFLAA